MAINDPFAPQVSLSLDQTERMAERMARRRIDSEIGAAYLVPLIMNLPEQIAKAQIRLNELRKNVSHAQGNLITEDAILGLQIANDIDPKTGKPKYGNEAARKAGQVLMQKDSQQYQEALLAVQQANDHVAAAEADLARLLNEFTAYSAVIKLQSSRLQLLAG